VSYGKDGGMDGGERIGSVKTARVWSGVDVIELTPALMHYETV